MRLYESLRAQIQRLIDARSDIGALIFGIIMILFFLALLFAPIPRMP